ncbi:hypothetical protein L207DRAFT_586215 [Hyaloscypha variabilis F]|uniref:Uncharacterized protein n=1 Tax=Hyaloscypha variabilis (strain UAMH 11265 / GT02V1 / F) TaxID=1149755 RepID=A0A2J6RDB3_HYAVF|nr:hypothetical protein L207DRAFT_586215 [Hyaloscypha variabilis F]
MAQKATAVVKQGDAVARPSKIPRPLRFPLVVLLSLTLSSLLYSFASSQTADLARVSRSLDQWWQVGALVGWRTFELSLGWYGDYDGNDLAALTLLSHGPPLYLLGTFYEIRPIAVLLSLSIDIATTYIPFRLLRPLSLAHSASNTISSVQAPNNEILTSTSIQIYTTILAAAIYSVTLYTAYLTFLPVQFATYFSNIPTLAPAYAATPYFALPSLDLPRASSKVIYIYSFGEHIVYNVWGYSKRSKVVIKRTVALMLVSGVNTFVQAFFTIEGVEAAGAVSYASVWLIANGITGSALGAVSSA